MCAKRSAQRFQGAAWHFPREEETVGDLRLGPWTALSQDREQVLPGGSHSVASGWVLFLGWCKVARGAMLLFG